MKKKAILALPALFVALAGIVMTGCPTEPEPEPDRTSWTYTSPSMEITIPAGENAEVNIFPDEELSATKYRILKDAKYEISFTGTADVAIPRFTAGFADWGDSNYWIAVDWENKQAIQAGSAQTVTWQVTATAFSVGAYATKHHNLLVLRAEYEAGPDDDQPLTQDVKLTGTWTIKQLTAGSTPEPEPEPEPDGEGFIEVGTVEIKANTWDGGGNWQQTIDAATILSAPIASGKTYQVTITGSTDVVLEAFKVAFIDGSWNGITTYANPENIPVGTFTKTFTINTTETGLTAPPSDLTGVKMTLVNENVPTVAAGTVLATLTNVKIKVVVEGEDGVITAYGLTVKSTHTTITPTLVSAYLQNTTDWTGSWGHKFDSSSAITTNSPINISFTDLGDEAKAYNNFRLDLEFPTSAIGSKAKLEISGFSITSGGANIITGLPAFAREGTESNGWTKEPDITTQLSAGVYQIEVTVIGDTESSPTKGIANLALPLSL